MRRDDSDRLPRLLHHPARTLILCSIPARAKPAAHPGASFLPWLHPFTPPSSLFLLPAGSLVPPSPLPALSQLWSGARQTLPTGSPSSSSCAPSLSSIPTLETLPQSSCPRDALPHLAPRLLPTGVERTRRGVAWEPSGPPGLLSGLTSDGLPIPTPAVTDFLGSLHLSTSSVKLFPSQAGLRHPMLHKPPAATFLRQPGAPLLREPPRLLQGSTLELSPEGRSSHSNNVWL